MSLRWQAKPISQSAARAPKRASRVLLMMTAIFGLRFRSWFLSCWV
jgi:hypothetical protein